MATQSSSPNQGGFAGWRESAPSSENGGDSATHSTERSETSEPDPASDRSTRQQILETDFAELKDGTLLEVVQDPENSARTLLAVWKGGEVRYVEELEDGAHVLVPLQRRRNQIFDQLRLPNQARPYDSVQILLTRLERLISRCVSVEATHLPVLADFALSTWLVDRLSIAPHLSVVGLPQSGKTTLLKILSLVCRLALLVSDITSASFYRACAQFTPTMLIDEAGSARDNRTLRHMLRAGTMRDVISVQANRSFHAYGAKAISWLEPPDDTALNSRCAFISMFETTRTDLLRPDDVEIVREAASLQAQLLQFRFENYYRVQPGPVPGDEVLRPRSRDLLRALAAAHSQDVNRSQQLLRFFDSGQAVPEEPLSPEQNAVLLALYSIIHLRKDCASIQTGDLTKTVNFYLEKAGEGLRLRPRKVGSILTSLGFCNRQRTNSGWIVLLNRGDAEKLHQLAEHHGIEKMSEGFQKVSPAECELCRVATAKRSRRGLQIQQEGQTTEAVNLYKEIGQ
jgi:hypothetical protein